MAAPHCHARALLLGAAVLTLPAPVRSRLAAVALAREKRKERRLAAAAARRDAKGVKR